MSLSKVSINIENGNLGGKLVLNDGLAGIICTATAVINKMELDKVYVITSLKEAEEKLGLDDSNNKLLYSHIKDYFLGLNANTLLYILPVASTITMEHMLDNTKGYVGKLQAKAQGKIRLIGVSKNVNDVSKTTTVSLDADVDKAMIKGQQTAEKFAGKMQPFRFIVDAISFSGDISKLKDYNNANINRGSLLLHNKEGEKNNRIGLILGALSKNPVERRISRVKNGNLPIVEIPYIGDKSVDELIDSWEILNDKGYIFLRSFTGKSGYFYSSDKTATVSTDDYSTLSKGRVIDKAMLIAYSTYVNELNENVRLDEKGKLPEPIITSYEQNIINAINGNMREAISTLEVFIDPDQNIISEEKLYLKLSIVPVGYIGSVDISLGFSNPLLEN